MGNLNCTLRKFFTIDCEWKSPSLLSGVNVTAYKVKDGTEKFDKELTVGDDLGEKHALLSSSEILQYSYNASLVGDHLITIIPYIDNLEGEMANDSVMINTGNKIYFSASSI